MWTKEKPTKAGWYWIVVKQEELGCIMAIVPVEKIADDFQFSLGDEVITFESEEMSNVKYWNGPIDEPAIEPSMEEELGKVEMII